MADERTETFEVLNERGLHARPMTRLVQTAARFKCEMSVERDGQVANAKSVMGLLMLCCHKGAKVVVRARGADADEALVAVAELFRTRFGEVT